MKPICYVASAYTHGDVAINTRFQMQMFDELMNDGIVVPYVPLWSHFQHLFAPRSYQDWVEYDNALIPRFDACLRLEVNHPQLHYQMNESRGADAEVLLFKKLGKTVFYSKHDLYLWVKGGLWNSPATITHGQTVSPSG